MDHDSSAIADAKAAIRREALARRDGLPADMRAAAMLEDGTEKSAEPDPGA